MKTFKEYISEDGWPEEEAYGDAEYVLELIKEAENDEKEKQRVKDYIEERRLHWKKVFDDKNDYNRFIEEFNKLIKNQEFFMKIGGEQQKKLF